MPINQTLTDSGNNFRRRDLIIGYVDQLKQYGYPERPLSPCQMIATTDIFHPRELTGEQKAKYGCDVMFASNRGKPTEDVVEEDLLPPLEPLGFTRKLLMDIHDMLWTAYREGRTFTDTLSLKLFLTDSEEFSAALAALSADLRDTPIQRLFWQLNDLVYRYVVLEWLDEHAQRTPGFRMHLHGREWRRHASLAPYDQGPLEHGEELSLAFQAARFCLHLNSQEGPHQRLFEIMASGGTPVMRCKDKNVLTPLSLLAAFRTIATTFFDSETKVPRHRSQLSPTEEHALADYIFSLSQNILDIQQDISPMALTSQILLHIAERMQNNPDWLFPAWHALNFQSKSELARVFDSQDHRQQT